MGVNSEERYLKFFQRKILEEKHNRKIGQILSGFDRKKPLLDEVKNQ